MTYQPAAKGVLQQSSFDDCEFYLVACSCGCQDADHRITVEGDTKHDLVTVTIDTKQRWFGLASRLRAAWSILTKGYAEYETGIILNGQQAANYAGALTEASTRITTYPESKQTVEYELDDGPLTEEQIAAIRAASPVSDLPASKITRRLFESETSNV